MSKPITSAGKAALNALSRRTVPIDASGAYGMPEGDPTDIGAPQAQPVWGSGPDFGAPPDRGEPFNPYSGTADESPSTGSPWSADTSESPMAHTASVEDYYGTPLTGAGGITDSSGRSSGHSWRGFQARNQPGHTPQTTRDIAPAYGREAASWYDSPFSGMSLEERFRRTGSGSLDATGDSMRRGGSPSYGDMGAYWQGQRAADAGEAAHQRLLDQRAWEDEQDEQDEWNRANRASQDAYWQREHDEANRAYGGTQGNESETGERP